MTTINLKIAELRKSKGISQQDLAEVFGISFQSVSKWETGSTMPDITLLPDIAEYFNVSIDELLGIKPLSNEVYMPTNTDDRNSWNGKKDKVLKNRKYFWNEDYLSFLIKEVWKVKGPINVIEFRCGEGYFGRQLLKLLPEGSTYTGVDNEYYVNKAEANLKDISDKTNFIISDVYSFVDNKKYDITFSQAALRHMNKPMEVLKVMIKATKENGVVACIDVNRELEKEGRDYAVGMRLPFYMRELGLKDVDVRMNDKVMYVNPEMKDYEEKTQDLMEINGWDKPHTIAGDEETIELFMNRGLTRSEAEAYTKLHYKISDFFRNNKDRKSFLKVQGLLITYGRKVK